MRRFNIMLTRTGSKPLDFGLAKLRATRDPTSLFGMTRTATAAPRTAHGTIHYMAPEQIEGREAGARSDIWALGAVLYEIPMHHCLATDPEERRARIYAITGAGRRQLAVEKQEWNRTVTIMQALLSESK